MWYNTATNSDGLKRKGKRVMKRTIKIAVFLCLISLVSVFMFTACNTDSHTHTVAIKEAVAPTDNKAGLTTGAYCSVCGEILVTQELVPATGSVGLSYKVNRNGITCTVTGIGTCTDTKINIPRKIDGYKVTDIGDSAFSSCSNLTSITLPDSVITIGKWAFAYCNSLTSVTIPNNVITIGNSAFANCSNLTSVAIGDSVTTIGDNAFWNCSNLTSVTISNSVTTIRDGAFSGCSKLISVTFDGTVQQWRSTGKDIGRHIDCIDGTIAKNGTITYK